MILWLGLRLQSRAGFYVRTWSIGGARFGEMGARKLTHTRWIDRPVWRMQIARSYYRYQSLTGTGGKNADFRGHRLLQTASGHTDFSIPVVQNCLNRPLRTRTVGGAGGG